MSDEGKAVSIERQSAEIADFISSLQLTGTGKTVSLGFSVPSEMIDVINALRAGHRPGQARPEPETPVTPESPAVPAPPAL